MAQVCKKCSWAYVAKGPCPKCSEDFEYPGAEDFDPIYDKGALALYKSRCREDETVAKLSALKMQLSDHGLTDSEWMKALSFSLNRYVQRTS